MARRSSTSTRGSPGPARSRTRFVPLRVGTDIAFLGGIINYVLENELDFREYVVAYTNAAVIVGEDYQDTEDLDGLFSGFDPETRTYDPDELAVRRDRRVRATTGDEPSRTTHAARDRERAAARDPRHRGCRATRERDETLQHPSCVYQILKRHFARYTPEVVSQTCGVSTEALPRGVPGVDRELRPRAHHGAGLQRRLDPAQRRRAVHPHRRDPAAAARQHGPPRRRHHGAARTRQHPGLDRHPDAVQPAPRLPADAHRRPARDASTTGSRSISHPGSRASGPTAAPTG